MTELTGVNAAMCTPFIDGDQMLDEAKFADHIDRLIDAASTGSCWHRGRASSPI